MTDITFQKVSFEHKDTIFSWLTEPHILVSWDTTQGHKDDIINFMAGRKEPSTYCDGKYVYWIASMDGEPYAMLMSIQETSQDDIGSLKLSRRSKTGNTYGLDFMIGNPKYYGRGYGARTLIAFMDYFREYFDSKADTFLIDPAADNPKAKHVYEKAGFKHISDFTMEGDCSGAGKPHHLLIKRFMPKVSLELASIEHYPMIQNMARFYLYDMTKECGRIADSWHIPSDGLYECIDLLRYFNEASRRPYFIKVYDKIAGFIMIDQVTSTPSSKWNMGEFFVLGQYQGTGIGRIVAQQVWAMCPGLWEVSVIPENQPAHDFWEKIISEYTHNDFEKVMHEVDYDQAQPRRIIYRFESKS